MYGNIVCLWEHTGRFSKGFFRETISPSSGQVLKDIKFWIIPLACTLISEVPGYDVVTQLDS